MSHKISKIVYIVSGMCILNTLLRLLSSVLMMSMQVSVLLDQPVVSNLMSVISSSYIYGIIFIIMFIINRISKNKCVDTIDKKEYFIYLGVFLILASITSFLSLIPVIYNSLITLAHISLERYRTYEVFRVAIALFISLLELALGLFYYNRGKRITASELNE